MPSSRFGSVGVSRLVMRGAWRSIEASTAPIAKRRSTRGGSTLAAVGKKPSIAKPRPPSMRMRSVTTTPSVKIFPWILRTDYCGRWAGWDARYCRSAVMSLCSGFGEPSSSSVCLVQTPTQHSFFAHTFNRPSGDAPRGLRPPPSAGSEVPAAARTGSQNPNQRCGRSGRPDRRTLLR